MFSNKLVVGTWDKGLSKILQVEADLTLGKAKKTIRQQEVIKEQYLAKVKNILSLKMWAKGPPQSHRTLNKKLPMQL